MGDEPVPMAPLRKPQDPAPTPVATPREALSATSATATATAISVAVHHHDFDLSGEVASLRGADASIGAVACFVGTVRDLGGDQAIESMTLEHYPGMTERSLHAIADEAAQRWPLNGVRIVHRVGPLRARDQIVLVAVTSRHRGAAFQACEFIMDYLKTRAPFWKKERGAHGERWVDARDTDDSAAQRWAQSQAQAQQQ